MFFSTSSMFMLIINYDIILLSTLGTQKIISPHSSQTSKTYIWIPLKYLKRERPHHSWWEEKVNDKLEDLWRSLKIFEDPESESCWYVSSQSATNSPDLDGKFSK